MGNIRYGGRSVDQLRNRELETTSVDTWATTLTAVYETDPEAIAAVLPQPLTPSTEPLVRVTFATVDIGHGRAPFGAGTFSVEAMHDGLIGGYPLVMPMTTEQAVVGGRETFGEPKKLADVTLTRVGDDVRGWFARMGVTFVEINGRVVGEEPITPDRRRTDFYFKFLLDPSGKGFDSDPALVYCHRDEKTRAVWKVDGELILRESKFDPVADLPVRKLRYMEFAERSSKQHGEIITTVPGEWVRPFVHQRYDDLSVIGAAD
ncbi:MAG: acetoacetate decarboxylase family protein [Actinomycetota bacterium]